MAYVVADPCVKCKYTDCVAVCPVDCFYEGKNSIAIHPDECIDCGACEPECPTTAIFEESELPTKWAIYKDINALVSGAKKATEIDISSWPEHLKTAAPTADTWPNITEQKKPLPGADEAAKEDNKIGALTLEGGSLSHVAFEPHDAARSAISWCSTRRR
jgi:ferredoxin